MVVDLSRDNPGADRRALGGAVDLVPTGSRIALQVGARMHPPPSLVGHLRALADRHHVDVHGTAPAVVAWVAALRDPTYGTEGWL